MSLFKCNYLWKMVLVFQMAFLPVALQAEVTATEPTQILNVYQISNLAELRWVSENSSSWTAEFLITANIDAAETSTWNEGQGFSPIGTDSQNFSGTINNAGNFVISNLTINRLSEVRTGFFGDVGAATISNIVLTNVDINGENYTGGLVGDSSGAVITNCSVTGAVTAFSYGGGLVGRSISGSITGSSANTTVTVSVDYGGGLVGYNQSGVITTSSSAGTVAVSSSFAGGLVGHSTSNSNINLSNSTANVSSGSYAGGLVGYNIGSAIADSYATGTVNVTSENAGGLVGFNENSATITASYATGSVEATSRYAGGLVGFNDDSSIQQSYATGSVETASYGGGLIGRAESSATISDNYAHGAVVASTRSAGGLVGFALSSTLTNCYADGSVSSSGVAGGIFGDTFATAVNCFFDSEKTGQSEAAGNATGISGATALTTAQMKVESNFVNAGWDFTNVWAVNNSAPFFKSQPSSTVTFVLGTEGTSTDRLIVTVLEGDDATAPTVTPNAGWTFTGWDEDFTNVTEDLQVNALYEAVVLTVTFDLGDHGTTTDQLVQSVNYAGAAVAPIVTADEGWEFVSWDEDFSNVTEDLTVTAQYQSTTAGPSPEDLYPRYRLYNPNDGNHHWTTNLPEYQNLEVAGWLGEGFDHRILKEELTVSSVPAQTLFRLYNPNSGEHHWTMSQAEYDAVGAAGWVKEGTDGYAFTVEVADSVILYRIYNPNSGLHHYTTNVAEYQSLVSLGWNDEGISAYVFPVE